MLKAKILEILSVIWEGGKAKRTISRRNMDRLEQLYILIKKMTKKFRFYDKEYKQWRELPDLLGDYQAHAFRTYGEGFELRHFLNADAQEKILSGDLVVQQWTGFFDADGKEMYEGDFIYTSWTAPAGKMENLFLIKFGAYDEYENAGAGFYCEDRRGHVNNFYPMIKYNSYRIIGNIFENPIDNRPTKD